MNKIERIEQIEKELAELKQQVKAEQEIKPVFPPIRHGHRGRLLGVNHNNARDLGLTADDSMGVGYISVWLRARARIIERINIANRGDNGFKAGNNNYSLSYGHSCKCLFCAEASMYQSKEPQLYIRTKEAAKELLNNPHHLADMKIYMSIGDE